MLAALAGASAGLESDIPTASPAPNGSAGPADSEAAEQSRRLAEARYRTLIEQIPAVTFLASLALLTLRLVLLAILRALLILRLSLLALSLRGLFLTRRDSRLFLSHDSSHL